MKSLNLLLLGLLATLIACPASADNRQGFYLGGGLSKVDAFKFPQDENALEVKASEIFLGYKYNPFLGLEVRAGFGEGSERVRRVFPPDRDTVNINYQIDRYYSLYYKPEAINDIAKLYGLLGFTSIQRSAAFRDTQGDAIAAFGGEAVAFGEAEINGSRLEDSTSGFSYGIGVGFVAERNVNVNFEYRYILRNSDERISTTGFYFDYRF